MKRFALLASILVLGCNDGSAPVAPSSAAVTAASSPPSTTATPGLSASTAPSPSSAPAPGTVLWLVATDPTVGAKQPGAVKIGCDDWLVPTPVTLTASDKKGQLVEATTKLLAAMHSKLTVAAVKDAPDGLALDLKGPLSFGGTCDPPRLIQPVERTVAQFGKVTLSVDGQARAWRCAADESGKCK
jgi:hypothetical protein